MESGSQSAFKLDISKYYIALGTFGFAITTILLSFLNSNILYHGSASNPFTWFRNDQVSIAFISVVAIFIGGIIQITASGIAFKKNDNFLGIVFLSFGFFWVVIGIWNIINLSGYTKKLSDFINLSNILVGLFFILYSLLCGCYLICALYHNKVVTVIFSSLVLAFLFLALGLFTIGNPSVAMGLTIFGSVCAAIAGLLALYISFAEILIAGIGKEFFKLGKPFLVHKKQTKNDN